MNFTCLIIDDEQSSITALKRLIEDTDGLTLVGVETDPVLSLTKLRSGEYEADITFVDIEMPSMSGTELAPLIESFTTVIFVTGHPDYAPQSYELGIVDFIIKPVSAQRFNKCIERVSKMVTERKNKQPVTIDAIYVFTDRKKRRVKIFFSEIIYLESISNTIKIHTDSGEVKTYSSLEAMELSLPAPLFMRIHRSFIINLEKIKAYEDGLVILEEKRGVPVGRKYKRQFLDRMGF